LVAAVTLPEKGSLPGELQVSFRVPAGKRLSSLTVNGKEVRPAGLHEDAALFPTSGRRTFEVVAAMS
jgi:hypothetical protein